MYSSTKEGGINLVVPLPPSSNRAYKSIGRGRRALSAEGRAYKRLIKDLIGPEVALDPHLHLLENSPLSLNIKLNFQVENKGWPTKAKKRYKKVDVSNRIKLLEDSIFEVLAVDDSQVLDLTISKTNSKEEFASVHIGVIGG